MSTVLDDLNTQLSGYIQDVEAIKEKIKQVAQSKNITIVENVDTPISVLNKINAGTIATPTGTLSVTANDTYNVTSYAFVNVNVQGGSGGTKYAHHIYITWNGGQSHDGFFDCSILIINDNSNAFTQSTLSQYLIDNGYTGDTSLYNGYPCLGSRVISYQDVWNSVCIFSSVLQGVAYNLVIMYEQNGQTISLGIVPDNPGTLTDTVEQIN